MADHIAALVRAAGAAWVAPRAVTPEEHRALACNRCGACCEDNPLPHSPEELDRIIADPAVDPDRRAFAAGLVPVRRVAGGWQYRCRHFRRDSEGLGLCTIYDSRPNVCRDFPQSGIVRRWPQCSWYVEIQVIPSARGEKGAGRADSSARVSEERIMP
jgi:Fe-S-cluster containining protein